MKLTYEKPMEIENRSMELIRRELEEIRKNRGLPTIEESWTPQEYAVVSRCIHTSADFEYADQLYFSDGAMAAAVMAFSTGAPIVTDTQMAAAGINKTEAGRWGSSVHCFMSDADVAEEAVRRGVTRATVCMERAAQLDRPAVIAVGNAPTALVRLRELIDQGEIRPLLIIAVPVGFVNVTESKELIMETEIPCIVARGRKGGSNVAAAVCNAIYKVAKNLAISDKNNYNG